MSITSTKCYFKKPQTGRRVKCLRKILIWTRQALSKITFLFQKHLNHSRLHEGQEVFDLIMTAFFSFVYLIQGNL